MLLLSCAGGSIPSAFTDKTVSISHAQAAAKVVIDEMCLAIESINAIADASKLEPKHRGFQVCGAADAHSSIDMLNDTFGLLVQLGCDERYPKVLSSPRYRFPQITADPGFQMLSKSTLKKELLKERKEGSDQRVQRSKFLHPQISRGSENGKVSPAQQGRIKASSNRMHRKYVAGGIAHVMRR